MKTSDEMLNSLLERRDRYIAAQRRKRKAALRVASAVCCLCLAGVLGFGIWRSGYLRRSDVPAPGDGQNELSAGSASEDENPSSSAAVENAVPSESVGENPSGGASKVENASSPAKDEYAVYTDAVMLPEETSGVAFDMVGCLVYKGKVYTQSTCVDIMDDPALVERLVGEYVGEAKGTLDEWSSQADWATEFASTYSGPVYKVHGYSEEFRLCIYVHSDEEQWLQLLDNYDGIGLNTGADLFEDRLHITGNVERVTFLSHDDWNEGNTSGYRELTGVTEKQFEDFLEELCASPFERIEYATDPDFYDAEIQGHLYLTMKDGTLIELRMMEGGYVGCQSLGWIFVKMPGELFDAVMAACR